MANFDGTAETSLARVEAYLAGELPEDWVPVEHAPPVDPYDLVVGDLRLLAGLVSELRSPDAVETPRR